MLKVKDLNLTFPSGESEVFKNVSFELKQGETLLITGGSGVGKSALLMCLSGMIPEIFEGVIKGSIAYNGKEIMSLSPKHTAGEIAYMFQDPDSQLCTFTVEDEIVFGLENLNYSKNQMKQILDKTLKQFKIEHLRERTIGSLSGGEKQKVALASLVAMGSKLMLLDEPTSNLDPQSTEEMVALIQELQMTGISFIIVEHHLNLFTPLANRVMVLYKDEILEVSKSQILKMHQKYIQTLSEIKKNIKKNVKVSEEQPLLNVRELNYSHANGNKCLTNVGFEVKKGEIIAIAGPNGAGKTTLSKLLMKLKSASSGSIDVLGKTIEKMPIKELCNAIGYVFQNPEHQFITGSVQDEMEMGFKLKNGLNDATKERIQEMLKTFDLVDKKGSNPFTLSQGQKRRLSTALMLVNGQQILILDEPTFGQDAENRLRLMELLCGVNAQGVSIIMITHDMEIIQHICDRVVYLVAGQVVDDGGWVYAN